MAALTSKQVELWDKVDTFVSQLEDEGFSFEDIVKITKEYGEIMEELGAK